MITPDNNLAGMVRNFRGTMTLPGVPAQPAPQQPAPPAQPAMPTMPGQPAQPSGFVPPRGDMMPGQYQPQFGLSSLVTGYGMRPNWF